MRHDAQGTSTAPREAGTAPLSRLHSLPLLRNVPADLTASLMVFLVAVPLSLGIAVASGAPLVAGLIAAAVGGIVAGAVGGSAVQVSGPTAGLTIIIADLVHTYGWRVTCLITLLAGLIQIAMGAFRIARAALAVSPAVIHGMLAGVGITIGLAQVHVLLGGEPQSSAIANITGLPRQLLDNHTPAVAVGVLTIAVLLVWPRLPVVGRIRLLPAALVAVAGATAFASLAQLPVERVDLPDSLAAAWSGPLLPERADLHGVAIGAVTVALVASVETLLCAIAVDRLHDGPRANLNRELIGQGAANTVSGALGGLPVAGVIVRSTANARAGARTPLSAIMHGVWVVVFIALLATAVEQIPMAALAGLLVFISAQMISLARLRDLRRHREASVYLVALGAVVVFGLLEGVIIGFAVAILVSLRRLTRVTVLTEEFEGRWHIVVQGSLTFLGVPRVAHVLRTVPSGTHVDLDLHVDFMDHAAFESIHAWRLDHERTGGSVDIDEVHENWYERRSRQTPPADKTTPSGLSRWWAPWQMRGFDHSAPPSGLLLSGAREYHASTAGRMRSIMSRLAHRQHPKALFITCADSRVVPNVITASGPGDLFTVRNIGNLVPRQGTGQPDDSVGAAVEYAVTVLEVPSVVVCGHSNCGAMKALLEGTGAPDSELAHLGRWLGHGEASAVRAGRSQLLDTPAPEAMRLLSQANVVQQLENLLTYPVVRRRQEEGRLELTGMYYDLETAEISVLDPATGEFAPIPAAELNAGPPGSAAKGAVPPQGAPPADSDPAGSARTQDPSPAG
ncbi:bifunctional SulP family inorganic anion transporter/carbonic anhydrase [Streptomonospora sp. S1-112]|uniref:carbonic anhydrase n=1 Tax=Streptomonospora mangrovi TaxID=2883123 RepID=A0A9X3SG15_9ACTN|nr:bifunctional SulP family inorganic anion transporter/carbonic anhydrase [Streptomonospora mangrovi]MDA0566427.1 bifunctional SulP family inorganic anion transporter/carbonic anhydrase [Streptomonospora mangrovi]